MYEKWSLSGFNKFSARPYNGNRRNYSVQSQLENTLDKLGITGDYILEFITAREGGKKKTKKRRKTTTKRRKMARRHKGTKRRV